MYFIYFISACLIVSPVLSRPQKAAPEEGKSTPIPIVNQSDETKEDGGFSYSYETGNGIKVEESGSIKAGTPTVEGRSSTGGSDDDNSNNTILVLQGSFSYTAPDGQLISVKYIADEKGFQPEGEHLPTAPPAVAANIVKNVQQDLNQKIQAQPASETIQNNSNSLVSQQHNAAIPAQTPTAEVTTISA